MPGTGNLPGTGNESAVIEMLGWLAAVVVALWLVNNMRDEGDK